MWTLHELSAGESYPVASKTLVIIVQGHGLWQSPEGGQQEIPKGDRWLSPSAGEVHVISGDLRLFVDEGAAFDPVASPYAALVASHNEEIGHALLQDLCPKDGQLWMDLGTGTGIMARLIAERSPGSQIIALDSSQAMLEEAARRARDKELIWYVKASLPEVLWPSNMASGATALLSLHLIHDLQSVIAGVFRSLRPGAYWAMALSTNENPFLKMVMRTVAGPNRFFHHGETQIMTMLTDQGFRIDHTRHVNQALQFPNTQALAAVLKAIGAPAQQGWQDDRLRDLPDRVTREFQLIYAQKPNVDE